MTAPNAPLAAGLLAGKDRREREGKCLESERDSARNEATPTNAANAGRGLSTTALVEESAMPEAGFMPVAGDSSSHLQPNLVTDRQGRNAKACFACRQVKPMSEFASKNSKLGLFRPRCKACTAEVSRATYKAGQRTGKTAEQNRQATLRQYGLSPEGFQALLKSQGGKCAICRSENPSARHGKFCIDHCHKTGRIRGLLCHPCNVALGRLGDNPEAIKRVLDYVSRDHDPKARPRVLNGRLRAQKAAQERRRAERAAASARRQAEKAA